MKVEKYSISMLYPMKALKELTRNYKYENAYLINFKNLCKTPIQPENYEHSTKFINTCKKHRSIHFSSKDVIQMHYLYIKCITEIIHHYERVFKFDGLCELLTFLQTELDFTTHKYVSYLNNVKIIDFENDTQHTIDCMLDSIILLTKCQVKNFIDLSYINCIINKILTLFDQSKYNMVYIFDMHSIISKSMFQHNMEYFNYLLTHNPTYYPTYLMKSYDLLQMIDVGDPERFNINELYSMLDCTFMNNICDNIDKNVIICGLLRCIKKLTILYINYIIDGYLWNYCNSLIVGAIMKIEKV